MTGEAMERRVLISHATDDPEWTPDQVEAVASAIQQAGLHVSLDLWHQRDAKRHLSLAEWRGWMDTSIDTATHILCLVSTRYRELWDRPRDVQGGFGVAFESIRLIHHLYLLKQHNDGRILTLRPDERGYDCIPRDLALDCPDYRWATDRAMLLSHVGKAALPSHAVPQGRSPGETFHALRRPEMPLVQTPPLVQTHLSWASDSGQDQYGHWADLTVNGVAQRMRWIPPTGPEGFWICSPAAESTSIRNNDVHEWADKSEYSPRREQVSTGFWLADTPCTQAFWRAVAATDPSHFTTGADAPLRPVERVSWDDVMDHFIVHLNARLGWGEGDVVCLPTELEWEYACRAGTRTTYWWGDAWDDGHGNAGGNIGQTTQVKRYPPNPWGLYDMHGDVWEWCENGWQPPPNALEVRPDKNWRVVRGGAWITPPDRASSAFRHGGYRWHGYQYRGFRFAIRSSAEPDTR